MVKASKVNGQERKRQRSTEKEKRRNLDINRAFESLQNQLPSCVPKGNRLPKIKTLRLAIKYIEHLSSILNGDHIIPSSMENPRPLLIEDFASVALREIQIRNTYTSRIAEVEDQKDVMYSDDSPLSDFYQLSAGFGNVFYY
ncbi:unnamed protein product [Auanema sp. JU1783]|nr:unnamed protein product [Auanema sp. JU1783]